MSFPQSWHVGPNLIERCHESEESIFRDPRGLLHVWEEPITNAHYILGLDPTEGHTGWTRGSRIDGDHKTDNASFEIFRVDALRRVKYGPDGLALIDKQTGLPEFVYCDLQVAEYAAPIDAVEAARVASVLGRLYCGDAEEQCELIYESWPGPGMLTTQELLRLGYSNLWQWEYIADSIAEPTGRFGWRSSEQTQRLLWQRARRHLLGGRAKIMSPWLLAEYRDAVIDPTKMRAMSSYGAHDDRIQSASLCYWAGHKWVYDPDRPPEDVTNSPGVDWQRRAPTLDEPSNYRESWSELVDSWNN